MISRLLGSICIISGTSIGAGMIAMPLITASIGFGYSITLMLCNWLVAVVSGLLVAEICQTPSGVVTLYGASYKTLGRVGAGLATLSMICLPYALCSAYISGAAGHLSGSLEYWWDFKLPVGLDAVFVTLVFVLIVAIGTKCIDVVNQGCFYIQILAFVIVVLTLLPKVDLSNFNFTPDSHLGIITALPLFTTSFGFHIAVPSVVRYLGGDRKLYTLAVIIGGSIPLVIYIAWILAIDGVVDNNTLLSLAKNGQDIVSTLVISVSDSVNSKLLSGSINLFATTALLTSFLGVSLSLFDYVFESLASDNVKIKRLVTTIIVFAPPLIVTLFSPYIFINALGYGAVASMMLSIFLPSAIFYRRKILNDDLSNKHKILLVGLIFFGVLVVLAHFFTTLEFFNST